MTTGKWQYWKPILIVLGIAMIFYLPTREFLKITFMLGIPFVFVSIFMSRRIRYSFTWFLSGIILVGVIGLYGYMLVNLPERIQIRQIVSEGGALVAEGKYDSAIEKYQKLEQLGKTATMTEKIQAAEQEKKAYQDLEIARELIKAGRKEDAIKLLDSIPADTRAAAESRKLRKDLE